MKHTAPARPGCASGQNVRPSSRSTERRERCRRRGHEGVPLPPLPTAMHASRVRCSRPWQGRAGHAMRARRSGSGTRSTAGRSRLDGAHRPGPRPAGRRGRASPRCHSLSAKPCPDRSCRRWGCPAAPEARHAPRENAPGRQRFASRTRSAARLPVGFRRGSRHGPSGNGPSLQTAAGPAQVAAGRGPSRRGARREKGRGRHPRPGTARGSGREAGRSVWSGALVGSAPRAASSETERKTPPEGGVRPVLLADAPRRSGPGRPDGLRRCRDVRR